MTTSRSSHRALIAQQRGAALILTLLLVLVLSVLAASLVLVSQSEAWSGMNYRMMTQVRFGAEAGVHRAANYLVNSYTTPGYAGDPVDPYTVTASPVTYNGNAVVLSSNGAITSNYPVASVAQGFHDAVQGTLQAGSVSIAYSASATLLSMRQVQPYGSTTPVSVQTWLLTGYATIAGVRNAQVEVSSVLEQQVKAVYQYAAFATYPGCEAMKLVGNVNVNSYDSTAMTWDHGSVVTQNWGANVGTNGNLTESGSAMIYGNLGTPRAGVGDCRDGDVPGWTRTGGATVAGGMMQLPQVTSYTTPTPPDPTPPTTTTAYNGGSRTLAPGTYGNLQLTGGAVVHLTAGTYGINSLSMAGNSSLVIDSGPVTLNVAGQGQTTPIDFTGGTISNATMDPSNLQILYGGTGQIKLSGGAQTCGLVYAPNAQATLVGGTDWYGALVVQKLDNSGSVQLHYDRHLSTNEDVTIGNPMLHSFTWKKF